MTTRPTARNRKYLSWTAFCALVVLAGGCARFVVARCSARPGKSISFRVVVVMERGAPPHDGVRLVLTPQNPPDTVFTNADAPTERYVFQIPRTAFVQQTGPSGGPQYVARELVRVPVSAEIVENQTSYLARIIHE